MTINIFVLKGDLNGENRSGAFLFLSGIYLDKMFDNKIDVRFQDWKMTHTPYKIISTRNRSVNTSHMITRKQATHNVLSTSMTI